MTGAEINEKFERNIWGNPTAKFLDYEGGAFTPLGEPSDATYSRGVLNSVTEQAHPMDAAWDDAQKRLTLRKFAGGPGLWIPFVGNVVKTVGAVAQTAGVAQTKDSFLGTYTPVLPAGGGVSWVASGPFSGCYAVTFSPGGGKVFAHVVTPYGDYTCATANQQINDIAAATGAAVPVGDAVLKVAGNLGEGFVFWTLLGRGVWHRRVVWAWENKVRGAEKKSVV